MRKNMSAFSGILFAVIEIIIGVVLLIKPLAFTNLILNIFGIILIIAGVINVISYFLTETEIAVLEQDLTNGIGLLVVGIFLIVAKKWLLSIIPVISIIYGIIILFGGINKIQKCVDLIRLDQTFWVVALIQAIVSIILAIIIFKNPFTLAKTLWIFVGMAVIAEGIFNTITSVFMFAIRKKEVEE